MSIPKQHGLIKSIFLHLVPGFTILISYLVILSLADDQDLPPFLVLLLGFLFIGIPIQLGILLKAGYRKNGRMSMKGIFPYLNKIPGWQYPVILIIMIIYAIIVSAAMSPVSAFLEGTILSSLPPWVLSSGQRSLDQFPQNIIVIAVVAKFVIDGIINPVVEEFYFRGYLMPRISRFGMWTPLLHAALFSLAHLWQPSNIPQIFIMVVPLYYLVWWKRNIYISIMVHCTANIIGGLFMLSSI